MKKVKKSLLIVFALIMVLATVFAFVGCKDKVEKNEAKSIAIVIDGEKITLEEGAATVDAIKSAITVEATLNDGTKVVVTDYEITGFDPNAEGEQTVTVTYKSLTATVKVEVSKSQEEPTPVKIEIQKAGDKLELTENNATVDAIKSAITVKVVYSDNSEKTVSDYEISGFNPGAEGEQNVSIKHSGLTATLVVIVNHSEQPVLTGITVASTDDSISLDQGYASVDALKALITVTAEYSDGSSVVVTDYEVIGLDVNAIGTQTVTVKYGETTVTVDVQIIELIVSFDYKVVINGNVAVKLNPMDCDDPHVTEQYSATFNLAKGDSIVITDVEGKGYANFEPDCKFNGEATVSGSYTLYLKFYQDGGDSIWVTVPEVDDPDPTPELVIKVIVGETEYTLKENTETDKSDGRLAEYMATITLNVGDSIVIVDNNNHEYVNYEPNCTFKGTALATGDHDIYVKIYPDGDSIWVTAPEGDDPDPTPELVIKVIVGETEYTLTENTETDKSDGRLAEYMGTITLNVGDSIVIVDNNNHEYVNYEPNCTFKGTALATGDHDIYVKIYPDGDSIWVTAPEGDDPDPTPDYTVSVVINGDVENAVVLTAQESTYCSMEYTGTFTLAVGDTINVLASDGYEYTTYENADDFDGTAKVEGEYTIYVKCYEDMSNQIYTVVPQGEIVDPEPTPELVIKVIVGETEYTLTENTETDKSDGRLAEYMGTVTLNVGDSIVIVDNNNHEYVNYEPNCTFKGTALATGDHDIYVKIYPDGDSIWVTAPEVEDPDPTPDYTVSVVINGDVENAVVLTAQESTYCSMEYTGTFTLAVGDTIKVLASDGYEYTTYENADDFDGTAKVEGEYTIYVKCYEDMSNQIYTVVPQGEIVDPEPTPELVIKVVVGETEYTLTENTETDKGDGRLAEYMGTITLNVGDSIVIVDNNNHEYVNYEPNCPFQGTALATGDHDIYVKIYSDGDSIWVTAPEVEDPDPTPDPEYTVSVVINGDVENAVVLTAQESTYCSMEYTGTFTLAVGDTIKVLASDGYEYTTYENADDFDGTAKVEGEYTIYVKCYEDMSNQIYTVVPQGEIIDPDPTPELVIKVVVGETAYLLIENTETDKGDGRLAEYMGTVTLNVGDTIVIIDNNNHEYVNYEPDCPFQGTAKVAGDHDIYVKIYSDGDSIWVTAPEVEDPDPTPDYTVSVVINGDVENAVVLTAQESTYCSMEYTGTFTLAVGDTIKVLASDGYEYTTYENADAFNGTAKADGEYTIYVKCYEDMSNAIYTQVPSTVVVPDPDVKSITVYYYNKDKWAKVNAYAWTGSATNAAWPGVAMTAVEGHDGWYSIEVSTSLTSIIFNNGSGKQTGDLTIDINNVYHNGYEWTDGYNLHEGKTTRTVYYYNKDKWAKVNAYAWTSGGEMAWPGVAMTAVEGHDGWYSIELSLDLNMIIFNNGSAQTGNITMDTSSDTVYYNNGWVKSM